MKVGEAFYSKKLGRTVVYIGKVAGHNEFVTSAMLDSPGGILTTDPQGVGVLEPLIRNCHYSAALRTSNNFVESMVEATMFEHKDWESDFAEGWWACIAFIGETLRSKEDEHN